MYYSYIYSLVDNMIKSMQITSVIDMVNCTCTYTMYKSKMK